MPAGPASPFFAIVPTPYGGRGAFASQPIPKDTLILSCEAPYASVICRKFRKEVCAWCFSWSLEAVRKSSWAVTVPLEPQQPTSGGKNSGCQRKSGTGGPNAGVWFCSEMGHAGVRGIINVALERCLTSMEKDKSKPRTAVPPSGLELGWIAFLQSLEDPDSGLDVSPSFLADAWERAERLSSVSRSSTPLAKDIAAIPKRIRMKVEPVSPTVLSELELDTSRFVLGGLLKKCIEEFSQSSRESRSPSISQPTGRWSDVLDLQDNALPHVQLKPYILASHIRIWAFIKFVVHLALKESKSLSEQTKRLLQILKTSVDSPADTRAILGREHGNVFGIWDMAPEGVDSEMLGWGLYSFGSYFNHDCSPTLYKKAKGRAMEYYALRDVEAGEELCISYVENNDEVMKRRDALKEWFFECACKKCKAELV
ncbi:putative lysine methyltransferase SET6 [Leucoagaricus sp. SymC.cos]|nr:putative lysine methyltransferase SET6 [Leucoagaricus sp. SymC.cos]